MIKIENVVTPSPEQWKSIIMGMRNPLNSWNRSDSQFWPEHMQLGDKDRDLMKRLADGGPVHAKYRRMITVYVDITAPLYWVSEHDTYKIGTVRNSCSFMHKGTSKPFEITDFSVYDERIYEVLSPLVKKNMNLFILMKQMSLKIICLKTEEDTGFIKMGGYLGKNMI